MCFYFMIKQPLSGSLCNVEMNIAEHVIRDL